MVPTSAHSAPPTEEHQPGTSRIFQRARGAEAGTACEHTQTCTASAVVKEIVPIKVGSR